MKGFVIGEQKYRIMKQSEIFVYPSYLESFGQVVCEAMACGLPVVAYDLPVYKEWYRDDLLYVNIGDINGLRDAALNLLEDPNLHKRMKNTGLKTAKHYTWDRVAKYELEIITQNY